MRTGRSLHSGPRPFYALTQEGAQNVRDELRVPFVFGHGGERLAGGEFLRARITEISNDQNLWRESRESRFVGLAPGPDLQGPNSPSKLAPFDKRLEEQYPHVSANFWSARLQEAKDDLLAKCVSVRCRENSRAPAERKKRCLLSRKGMRGLRILVREIWRTRPAKTAGCNLPTFSSVCMLGVKLLSSLRSYFPAR